jgi:hypothetical protein
METAKRVWAQKNSTKTIVNCLARRLPITGIATVPEDIMRIRPFLITAALVGVVGTAAIAQQVASYDPQKLPTMLAKVTQYSLTPRGDVDGVILEDGTQVHLPPHLGGQIVQAIKPGDTITVRGLKAQALPVMQGYSLTISSGKVITDSGPPIFPPQPLATASHWLSVEGHVREPLYGPAGDLNGALLDDGTQIHIPPGQATTLSDDLQAGKMLVAQGYGVSGAYGRSLDALQFGPSPTQLVQVGPPGPPPPQAAPPGPPGPPWPARR